MKKAVYVIPVVIALVGILAYFVVIPDICGRIVPVGWLFADLKGFTDTFSAIDVILAEENEMIAIRVFWYAWLTGLIASLFFVGRQLQQETHPVDPNAKLVKREPYFMMLEISSLLKEVRQRHKGTEWDELTYAIKKLEEKLSIESDFGYGSAGVIQCENDIAEALRFLKELAISVQSDNFNENICKMNGTILRLQDLMVCRREMKKRRSANG